jgi:hypothetical protein
MREFPVVLVIGAIYGLYHALADGTGYFSMENLGTIVGVVFSGLVLIGLATKTHEK